jgi:flagellin
MAMVVKNNMSAISTLNTLNRNSSALTKSLAKVSSGMKINGAADDASGYAISERMRVQIRSLDQDNQNTQNGISMMKVAEGAVSSTVEILKTLKQKVINAANDTNTDADRQTIQKELDQSIDQINDNANVTFNGKYLVDGSKNASVTPTTTSMTNESLNTATSWASGFSEMKDRNGNSLNINGTDTITLSYVHQGKTYITAVRGSDSFETLIGKATIEGGSVALSTMGIGSVIGHDIAGDTVSTASGETAMTITAAGTGTANQISGITISVTNTQGQIQKSANAVLDNFSESIRAEDQSYDNAIVLQVGAKANQAIKIGLKDMRAEALGLRSSAGDTLNISTQKYANAAINVLDNAVAKALDQQTTIGAIQSRLEYTSSNLTTASENVQASESTIRDADMAKEMTEYTKNNVLLQASQSMLAQANQNSSAVLSLLQ